MRISVIQASLEWENPDKNLSAFEDKINRIAPSSDLILLPEMFTTGFSMNPQHLAEQYPGRTVEWMQQISTNKNIALAGSHIALEKGNYVNRMVFAHPTGKIEYYDKRHLFRMAHEDQHYTAGQKRVIVNYMGWRILLLVCYDLRFPVWSRNRNDYDLILLAANFPERRRHVWNTLLAARAIENQCYVAACNRIGADNNANAHCGDSQIIDPLGIPRSIAAPNQEQTLTLTVSIEEVQAIRQQFPAHLDADNFEIL
ncbi:MAG: amidohydrolase [Bacteroidales bacterium]|nr:amidohydrolase [Bacteroidales bacterium]